MTTMITDTTGVKDFIPLRNKTFASYEFVYRINDGYSISCIDGFKDKSQLLFQRMSSKTQQLNLMMIDSVFPLLLADVALEVFLNKINTLERLMRTEPRLASVKVEDEQFFIRHKLEQFIYHLLFSEIANDEPYHGITDSRRVFCLKQDGELTFYSIFERRALEQLMMEQLQLTIDMDNSKISEGYLFLRLEAYY